MNPTNSAEALSKLQATQGTQKSLTDLTNSARQQYGVDQAQETVGGLRGALKGTTNLLKQVAPSIMGRTGGTLTTAAQASKQIQNESAPLQQTLTEQSGDYSLASSDLEKALANANQLASSQYGDQQSNLSYLQNLYNTMFQRESADKAAQQAELARQEQIRQFNEQLALSKKSAAGSGGISLGGGATPAQAPKAFSTQRSNGGFNFTDSGGKAISAAKYAQLTGQNVLDVLKTMGQAGDKFAAQTYNAIKAAPGVAARPSSLFWGT